MVGWVSSCGGFSLDGKECCFLWSRDEGSKRFVRVRCPVPGPPRSESWLVPLPAAGSSGWLLYWFCGGHGWVRRPVPFRTRKLRVWSRRWYCTREGVGRVARRRIRLMDLLVEPRQGSREVFFIPAHGCFPPFGGGKRTPEGPWAGGSLRSPGGSGRWGIPGISRELPALIRWWDRLGNHALFRAQTLCRIEQNHVSRRSDGPADRRPRVGVNAVPSYGYIGADSAGPWHLTHRDPQSSYTYVPLNQQIKPHSRKKGYKPRRK